jgi:hypothetical protein
MSSTETETLLTRFITLAKPDAISTDHRTAFFAAHPDEEESTLYATTVEDFIDLRDELDPLSKESLLAINLPLYDFAVEVWSKRKTITLEDWHSLVDEYEPIPLDDEISLTANRVIVWDNFIYHCTKQQDIPLTDICTTLLLANHWLEHISEVSTDKRLRRLLHSKLLIPQFLKFEGATDVDPTILMSMPPDAPIYARRTLDKYIIAREIAEASTYLDSLKHLDGQLRKAHRKYIKLETDNLKAYNAAYDDLLRAYYAQFPTSNLVVDGGSPIPDAEITDTTPPEIPLPVYDYQPLEQLDEERLAENLDENNLALLQELRDTQIDTFEEVFAIIAEETKRQQETILANNTTTETLINQDGMLLRIGESHDPFSTPGDGSGGIDDGGISFQPVRGATLSVAKSPGFLNRWYLIFTVELEKGDQIYPIQGECIVENADTEEQLGKQYTAVLDGISTNFRNLIFFSEGPDYIEADPAVDTFVNVRVKLFLNNGQRPVFINTVVLAKTPPRSVVVIKPNDDDVLPLDKPQIFSSIAKWGISRLGIGDYIKVTEKLCRYEPGEVAHIENVMAKEYREKFSRRFNSSELTETSEESYESEQQTDTSSSERYETSKEISKIQQMSTAINSNTNLEFKGGTIVPKVNTSIGMAFNSSREQAERMASSSSRELSEQATQRILIRKREERVRRLVNEFTEENRHGYDNRKGVAHVTGVYRWVDRIYKHTLTNYGKRLMYEFQVPEPASMHRLFVDTNNVEKLVKPIDPRHGIGSTNAPIATYKDINDNNFAYWAAAYNAEVSPPPPESIVSGKAFSANYEENQGYGRATHFDELEVPEGYELTSFDYVFMIEKHMKKFDNLRCTGAFSVGSFNSPTFPLTGQNVTPKYQSASTIQLSVSRGKNTTGTIPVSVATHDIGGFALNINATFKRLPAKYEEWQMQTFRSIIAAYEDALAIFEEQARRIADQQQQKLLLHPRYYREIEEKVLKKNCIAYLYENLGFTTLDGFVEDKKGFSLHKVKRSPDLDKYAAVVKFLEEAFEWENMTYIFYPFYWAHTNSWQHLYHNPCEDQLFKHFLESGFARVIVSVRPGFEDAVTWYMQTGQIWQGKDAPVLEEEEYLSIIEDLQNQEPKVIDQWEVRLPSTLTVLQNSGVGLVAEGLPNLCGDEAESIYFQTSGNTLTGKDEEEEPESPENPEIEE